MNAVRSKASPTRAIILAAGLGTRLRPLTNVIPKALVPLWGVPAIDRTLRMLRSWGVRDVLINLHHMAGSVFDHARRRRDLGLRITLSYEPAILGTGGALTRASWFLDEAPFWLINADIVANPNPRSMVAKYRQHRPPAVLWTHRARGPRTVTLEGDRVVRFRNPDDGSPDRATFCGLHLVSPSILQYLPPKGSSSIIDAYDAAMRDGLDIRVVASTRATWCDIGSPDSYLDAHRELGRVAADRSFRFVDGSAHVPLECSMVDSVVLAGATVRRGAALERAIIGPGADVCGHVSGLAVRARDLRDPELLAVIDKFGWDQKSTTAQQLAPRGSDRIFTRIMQRGRTAMVVRHGCERPENSYYVRNADILARAGVSIPDVLLTLPRRRAAVLEDMGNTSLFDLVHTRGKQASYRLYDKLLRIVHRLHTDGTRIVEREKTRLCKAFGPALYAWEHDLFFDFFLGKQVEQQAKRSTAIRAELQQLARQLGKLERVLVHRDLQSTNVLVKGSRMVLIDFQGMRMGPAAYDLASLLCDPYVALPEEMQIRLLQAYMRRGDNTNGDVTLETFWCAAVQRLVQALGAYGRLSALPGVSGFEQHIPAALKMLDRALGHVQTLPCLAEMVSTSLREDE